MGYLLHLLFCVYKYCLYGTLFSPILSLLSSRWYTHWYIVCACTVIISSIWFWHCGLFHTVLHTHWQVCWICQLSSYTDFCYFVSNVVLSCDWSGLKMPLHPSYQMPCLCHLYFITSATEVIWSVANYGPVHPRCIFCIFTLYHYSWSCGQKWNFFESILIYITIRLPFMSAT